MSKYAWEIEEERREDCRDEIARLAEDLLYCLTPGREFYSIDKQDELRELSLKFAEAIVDMVSHETA